MTASAEPLLSLRSVALTRALPFIVFCVLSFIIFFPVLFMGRTIFPLESMFRHEPWGVRDGEVEVQNAALRTFSLEHAPSLTVASGGEVSWNRFVGSGLPFSLLRSRSASPITYAAALFSNRAQFFTLLVLIKLFIAFVLSYRWLRTEGYLRDAASFGATLFAASGIYVANWFEPATAAAVFAPSLFIVASRMRRDKHVPLVATALIGCFIGVSGTLLFVFALAAVMAAYLVISKVRSRSSLMHVAVVLAAAAVLSVTVSEGSAGDVDLTLNRFVAWFTSGGAEILATPFAESTLYVGVSGLLAALLSFRARSPRVWLWWSVAIGVVVTTMIFDLSEPRMLLPLAVGALAAAGAGSLPLGRIVSVLPIVAAIELGFFAATFLPYVETERADLERSEALAFIRSRDDLAPARSLPLFDYLPPNAAALVGIEDVRMRQPDSAYASFVARSGTLSGLPARMELNPQSLDFASPVLGFLNVRFIVEQSTIDLVRWRINGAAVPSGTAGAKIRLQKGQAVSQSIHIGATDVYSIEMFVHSLGSGGARAAEVVATRPESGEVIHRRTYKASELSRGEKVYVPVLERLNAYSVVIVTITALDASLELISDTATGNFQFARVSTPLIPLREFHDGRLFENLAAQPRFFATWRLTTGVPGRGDEVMVEGDNEAMRRRLSFVRRDLRKVVFRVAQGRNDYRLNVSSRVPYLLASSERLSPDLRVTLDGRQVELVRINGLFAAVRMPAGKHEVRFQRRMSGGDRIRFAGAGGLLLLCVAIDLASRRRRLSQR